MVNVPFLESQSSDDLGDTRTSSFTVLNPADSLSLYGKPNAIVRPVRRGDLTEYNRNTEDNKSLQDLNSQNDITDRKMTKSSDNEDIKDFSKELDYKLKKLQKENKSSSKNVNIMLSFEKETLN